MPSMDNVYGGNALKAEDVPPTFKAVLTIESVMVQDFEDRDVKGKLERKLVLRFQGKDKSLVLNVTNANMVAEITGSRDYDYWPGHKILLYRTMTEFAGKRVPALRVDHPANLAAVSRPAPPPPPPPPPQREPGDDDSFQATDADVPFAWLVPALLPIGMAILASGLVA